MKTIGLIVAVLVIIGGLNWGLIGLFNFNVVSYLFGGMPIVERLIYVLVGFSAVYQVVHYKCLLKCGKE